MISFLVKGKKPLVKWGLIPDGSYFEGNIPEGYSLAVSPSDNYIVLDIDRHGDKDGFKYIPDELKDELYETLNYDTKNNGKHYWFKYTGNRHLANKSSGIGIDLRTNKGYVVWYPETDFRNEMKKVKNSSDLLNNWLESLFNYKKVIL